MRLDQHKKFRNFVLIATAAAVALALAVSPGRPSDPTVLEAKAAEETEENGLPLSAENYEVLGNVIGAVETGNQIYGNKDYSMYLPAFYGGSTEYTCTLGWCSCYGQKAEQLIALIRYTDPDTFHEMDPDGVIDARLLTDWVAEQWNPNEEEKQILINLISSPVGRTCQDAMFYQMVTGSLNECIRLYGTRDPRSLMMYAEIALLGGSGAAQRIFTRCNGDYSVLNILNSLFADFDGVNMEGYLVGSPRYWQRHLVCATYINQFAKD